MPLIVETSIPPWHSSTQKESVEKKSTCCQHRGVEGDKRSAITVKEQDLFASFSNQGQTVRGAFTRLPLVAAQSLQTHRLKENKRPDAIKDGIAVV